MLLHPHGPPHSFNRLYHHLNRDRTSHRLHQIRNHCPERRLRAELTPWTVSNIDPPLPEFFQYESYGVQAPGYDSANAFTVNDSIASSYFELDLDQTLTLCAGKKYNVKAQFYMTDSHEIPKQTYIEVLVDGTQIATSTFADGLGPPIVWKSLSGSFTAASASPKLTFKFAATDFVGVTWGLDKVVVTPA
jgi:hypothetical protein